MAPGRLAPLTAAVRHAPPPPRVALGAARLAATASPAVAHTPGARDNHALAVVLLAQSFPFAYAPVLAAHPAQQRRRVAAVLDAGPPPGVFGAHPLLGGDSDVGALIHFASPLPPVRLASTVLTDGLAAASVLDTQRLGVDARVHAALRTHAPRAVAV